MSRQPPRLHRFAVPLAYALLAAFPAHAQIPVTDVANLLQNITLVADQVTSIENQVQQIVQLQAQINNVTGHRGWGSLLDNPALHDYIPANAQTLVNAVTSIGYTGLSASAKALRDASMVYNCEDKTGIDQTRCQAILSQPYLHKALMQDSLAKASGRLGQIKSLLDQVDASSDPKEVAEIQARVAGESAMLDHEISQIETAHDLSEAEQHTQASQVLERRWQNLQRTFRVSGTYP